MKVELLKNYGKSLSDIILDPENKKYDKHVMKVVRSELRRELGLCGMMKLLLSMRRENIRVKNYDWSRLREHGPVNEQFLQNIMQQAAAMKALAQMMGVDRASEFYRRLTDRIGHYDVMAPMFPSIEEFKACGDAFEAFNEYAKAMIAADQRAGLHEVDIVEQTPDVFAYNVRYCVWNEIAKDFGVSSLCYAGRCYGDEVFFNSIMPKVGALYKRTGTLTLGAPVCDVRFERVASDFAQKGDTSLKPPP